MRVGLWWCRPGRGISFPGTHPRRGSEFVPLLVLLSLRFQFLAPLIILDGHKNDEMNLQRLSFDKTVQPDCTIHAAINIKHTAPACKCYVGPSNHVWVFMNRGSGGNWVQVLVIHQQKRPLPCPCFCWETSVIPSLAALWGFHENIHTSHIRIV